MRRTKANTAGLAIVVAGLVAGTMATVAQEWPAGRDITFIIPFGPGGSSDVLALAYTKELGEVLGANVVMDYRVGGSGSIGTGAITRADADGYTIGMASNGNLTMNPLTIPDLPYKTTEDYTAIDKLADMPAVLYALADSPWQTLDDVIAHAKANPQGVHAATSGLLTPTGLTIEMLNAEAGIDIVNVPLNSGAEALTQLLGGHVDVLVSFGPATQGQVEAGAIKPLSVFSQAAYDFLPDTELATEVSANLDIAARYYVVAPNGLPPEILERLVAASKEVQSHPSFQAFLVKNGFIPPANMMPEQLVEELKAETQFNLDALALLGQQPVQ